MSEQDVESGLYAQNPLSWGYEDEKKFLTSITGENRQPLSPEELLPLFEEAIGIVKSRAFRGKGVMLDFMNYISALKEACFDYERRNTCKCCSYCTSTPKSIKDLVGYNPMDVLNCKVNGKSILENIEMVAMGDDEDGLAFGHKVLIYIMSRWGWDFCDETLKAVDAVAENIKAIPEICEFI
jgi:hypothetical protein